jgi:hypothetical protein
LPKEFAALNKEGKPAGSDEFNFSGDGLTNGF